MNSEFIHLNGKNIKCDIIISMRSYLELNQKLIKQIKDNSSHS